MLIGSSVVAVLRRFLRQYHPLLLCGLSVINVTSNVVAAADDTVAFIIGQYHPPLLCGLSIHIFIVYLLISRQIYDRLTSLCF
jgi:hypothetical protein